MSELLPCPFCGTTDLYAYPDGDEEGHTVMGDHKEGCVFLPFFGFNDWASALAAWNTRASSITREEFEGVRQLFCTHCEEYTAAIQTVGSGYRVCCARCSGLGPVAESPELAFWVSMPSASEPTGEIKE